MSTDTRKRTEAERFAAMVNRDGPTLRPELGACHVWTGSVDRTGYGKFWPEHTTQVQAHRYAWSLAHGPVPRGLHVLHRCDNPPCVREGHLFTGTRSDNMRDMWQKQRGAGFGHGQAIPNRHITQR